MKGLMKVFSGGLALWLEWKLIGLLRVYAGGCAASSVGRLQKRWIDSVND